MSAVSLGDPQSLNLYAYCGNDPVNNVDPDGLFFKKLFGWIGKALKWIAIAAAIAVAVISIAFPGAWIANLAIWASKHSILSAILGINTPKFAIINLAAIGAKSGAIGLGGGTYLLSGIGAVTNFMVSRSGENQSDEATAELIGKAVNAANTALKKPHCKKLIKGPLGENPSGLLTLLHRNDKLISGEVKGARAVTIPTMVKGKSIFGEQSTIVFDKYIFSNSNDIGYRDVLGLTTLLGTKDRNVARATLILHELSHATGKNDAAHSSYGGNSDKMNQEIYNACFGGK